MKLLLVVLLLVLPVVGRAQFTFTTNNGAFIITGYFGPGGAVTIPGTSNGLPVIVGDDAFYYQDALTNLTLLNGVLGIGSNAFNSCINLTEVTVPGSVTNIGGYAFNYCQSLTNVVISNGVFNIDKGAFRLTSIESITIPGSVTNIGSSAFEVCSRLASVTISNGLKSIGRNAFTTCSTMPSVFIPKSVTNVGVGAFENCESLTNIAVDVLNANYASVGGVLFNKTLTELVEHPGNGNSFFSYVIPEGVTTIGDSAFQLCMLTNVLIPNSVTSIRDGAFSGCTQLPSIAIPSSVTNIGDSALSYCLKMTNISIDPINSNYASAGGALFDKTFQTLIRYPAGNTGNYIISESVMNIGREAFESCFLTNITIPNSVTNIGDWAFGYSALTDVTIPGSIRGIASNAFLNCQYLTNATILDGVTNIDSWAFYGCYSLNTVTMPASVETIGAFAFGDCTSLTNVYCLGNAPTVVTTPFSDSSTIFSGDSGTVYYLPGTTGWINTFGGMPTSIWKPKMLITGIKTNVFGFNINWASDRIVLVEACTNLFNPDWQPMQTITLTNGSAYFSDPQWTNYPGRFYRLR
jgi:hypothetical protein